MQYNAIPLSTAVMPEEGPKTIPLALDFTAQPSYPIDLQTLQSSNRFSALQSIYIDNSGNASPLQVVFDGVQQTITAKAYTQGYYTVLCPDPPRFHVTTAGTLVVRLQLINAPVAGAVWATQ